MDILPFELVQSMRLVDEYGGKVNVWKADSK